MIYAGRSSKQELPPIGRMRADPARLALPYGGHASGDDLDTIIEREEGDDFGPVGILSQEGGEDEHGVWR